MKLIVSRIAFAALVGSLLVVSATPRQEGVLRRTVAALPFQIEDVASLPASGIPPVFVADVDLDGNDDFLVNNGHGLLWYKLNGKNIALAGKRECNYRALVRLIGDANGDGRADCFVLAETLDGCVLRCYDWFSPSGPTTPIYEIGPLLNPKIEGDQAVNRISVFECLTAGGGARPMVFLGINALKSESSCRFLIAYDGANGRELWRFEFAPHFQGLACGDFGADDPRVLFTTAAVGKGCSCNGTTDSLSYVFCLDRRDGRLLWRKQLTGWAGRSHVSLADINGDGLSEVLVARYLAAHDPILTRDGHAWNVAALDHEGTVLLTAHLPIRATTIRAANLDEDINSEILVEGSRGELAILDSDFTVRRFISPPKDTEPVGSEIFGLVDMVGDKAPEIICRFGGVLVVRNNRGTSIAERWLGLPSGACIARCDGRDHIVAFSGKYLGGTRITTYTGGDCIHLMDLERTPVAVWLQARSRRLTAWAAALLIVGWALFSVRSSLKRRRERRIDSFEAQSELLKAMSAFGHEGSSLKVLDRLRLHLKNWERIRADGVTREELFAGLQQTYRQTIVPELEHLVMLARRASVPEGTWDALLVEAELAGREMQGIIAPGSAGAIRRDEHIAKALAALDAIDESIAGTRSHLRSVFHASVAEELNRLIERFQRDHGARGISFALAPCPSADAAAFISPVSFYKIFEVLLSNAVRATEGKAGAEIAVSARWEGDYCRLDVRDNGCGIPKEDWERIFDRHYTTKKEGGFGLHYAREELARFGGKIYVVDSVSGSGTTMRIILRKSEKAAVA